MKQNKNLNMKSRNFNLMLLVTFFIGVLLIFSAYAWFYAALDVKVRFVNLVVSRKSGLFISLDGIDFGSSVQISEESLIENLKTTYPNNTSQWSKYGLYPISASGLEHSDSPVLDFYMATNVDVDKVNKKSYITTRKSVESNATNSKNYIAFDLFLKNVTGSPVSDNLYIDEGTGIKIDNGDTEQMQGLINSVRMAFIKIGSVPNNSSVNEIQNISCNNNCEAIIYEPNATKHTDLSIERAQKYGVNLKNGQYYPTLAVSGPMNFFDITSVANGILQDNFTLQETRTDIQESLFEIPDGITKVRVYVWIEGQDIDSLETRSDGAEVSVIINLIKDTAGYDAFNE